MSILVLNKAGAVRKLVVTNSTPADCPLPCLTITQKSHPAAQRSHLQHRSEGGETVGRPLLVAVQSNVFFCNELRKDGLDGEMGLGSHTF